MPGPPKSYLNKIVVIIEHMITGYAQGLFFQGTRDQTVCSKRIRTNSLRNIGMYFRTN